MSIDGYAADGNDEWPCPADRPSIDGSGDSSDLHFENRL